MKTRSVYGSEVTRRARRVVADIFAALGHRAENAVLIGGAVPGFIEDISLRNPPGHAGTTDVDILLNPTGFSAQEYETLAQRLLERGYRYRKDRDGNELGFSFEVDVDGHSVAVDFLAPPLLGESGFRVPVQAGLQARALSGAHVPAWFSVDLTLKEELVQGGDLPVRIRLVDVPGFVVLKALAFEGRQAYKDAYDLWYVLAFAREGPSGIARKLVPYAGDSVVASALAFLRVAFASPASAGSVAVARFEEAGEEDAERVSAQAYAVVQSFLREFDVWGGEAARNGGES